MPGAAGLFGDALAGVGIEKEDCFHIEMNVHRRAIIIFQHTVYPVTTIACWKPLLRMFLPT